MGVRSGLTCSIVREIGADDSPACYPTTIACIFPTFHLLPPSSGGDDRDAVFRLRPVRAGEAVPVPPTYTESVEEPWLTGNWIFEYVAGPRTSQVVNGLVVRRNWLLNDAESLDSEPNWDGLMRVEHLLVRRLCATRATHV